MTVHDILDKVQSGDFNIAYNNSTLLDTIAILLKTPDDQVKNNPQLLQDLVDIITIGNIIYNYSDRDVMAIDDGIYDLLVVKLQKIDYSKFNPGAKPVTINKSNDKIIDKDLIRPIAYMGEEDIGKLNDSLYPEILNYNKPFDPRCYLYRPFYIEDDNRNVSKRLRNVSHNYPDLVGTLEKCKFVLDCQAKEAGAYEEPNVKIFERDFMVPLLMNGVINSTDDITMIGTLKYDGISIEADVTDHVISARTRGDTDMNIASDLTPILEGYRFPNAEDIIEEPIGMKFEAIVRYDDLGKMNEIFGSTINAVGDTVNKGAGIQMGISAGGATYALDTLPMVHISQIPNLIRDDSLTPEEKTVLTSLSLTTDVSALKEDGSFYQNLDDTGTSEGDSSELTVGIVYAPGFHYYNIYSQEDIDNIRTNGLSEAQAAAAPIALTSGGVVEAGTPIETIDKIMEVGIETKNVFKGTASQLASQLGMDEATTIASLGDDETVYYLVECAGYAYGTVGGLDIDANCNVLREDGTPIENLFAVGQDSEGVENAGGKPYTPWGGQAQMWMFVSGKIAGETAANYALAN